jgi:hypothetical protein
VSDPPTRAAEHAWLFQFKQGSHVEGWRRSASRGAPAPWKATRYRSDFRPGDVVFYWEAGPAGGLRGWGELETGRSYSYSAAGKPEQRIDVIEHAWVEPPIPRRRVFEVEAIDKSNPFRSNANNTNFRLTRREAQALAILLPPDVERPKLDQVKDHISPSATQKQEDQGWFEYFITNHRIGEMTPLVREILVRAANINVPPSGAAEISTTRLLIAMHDLGRDHDKPDVINRHTDAVGIIALARVLNSNAHRAAYRKLFHEYTSIRQTNSEPISQLTVTTNVLNILSASPRISDIFIGDEIINGDGLVIALLRQPNTKVAERFASDQIDWQGLRLAIFNEIGILDADRSGMWGNALGIPEPYSSFRPSSAADAESVADSGALHSPLEPAASTITFARLGNDNPEAEALDDKLGVDDEAWAFARVAAARQVMPPLAFGIFGDWGSGKSFFMRLIKEHVDHLQNPETDEAKSGLFHQNVVQIRFNAWHYVDSNLWASLVDHIFSELDRRVLEKAKQTDENPIFDKLATARDLTFEAAERLVRRRKDQKIAAQRVAEAERQLVAASEKPGSTTRIFWDVVGSDFKNLISKKELESAAKTLGLDYLSSDAEALKNQLDALRAEGQRAKVTANGIRNRLLARIIHEGPASAL